MKEASFSRQPRNCHQRRISGRLAGLVPRRALLALSLGILSLITARGASAAAFDPADEGWEGYSELVVIARAELGEARVRIITALDYSALNPADALMFVHPEVEIRFQPLAAFLAAGGRAAVIDDHGLGGPLLERFHIHRANPPTLPALRLRGNSNLPIALPAPSESTPEASDHPTLREVDQVVTNHPTALRLEDGVELTRLLIMPARGEPDALLAVTGVIGDAGACGLVTTPRAGEVTAQCGRLLAMGDPSAFINLMLRYPGNRSFARGLVSYLVEDDSWGRRGGNLYILTGRFRQGGSYGETPTFWDAVGEQRAEVMEWLEDARENGLPEPFSIALAAALAIAVAIWLGLAGGQLYVPALPAYARATPSAGQGGFAGRFAVLAAPSTDRGLILLELARTFEGRLRQRLRLPSSASRNEIVEAVERSGVLRPASVRALDAVLTQLSAGEVAVTSARRLTLSNAALEALHQRVLDILAEMNDQEGPRRDGSTQHG